MKLAVLLVLCSCAQIAPLGTTKHREISVGLGQDISFDHDQLVVCVYTHRESRMACMTPETYRALPADVPEPKDP
jgi:hypothetical protein